MSATSQIDLTRVRAKPGACLCGADGCRECRTREQRRRAQERYRARFGAAEAAAERRARNDRMRRLRAERRSA